MPKFKLLTLALTLLCTQSFASEADNFTRRFIVSENAAPIINDITNKYFAMALNDTNDKDHGCNEEKLYKSIRHYFRNHYFGELSKEIYNSKQIPRTNIPLKEGIYKRFFWYDAFVPGIYGRLIEDPSASVVRMNDQLVGVDKFEHFVGSGYRYFQKYYLKKKSLFSALKIGLKAETGFMGAVTTGVLSYADMVANFNGMRFWNDILAKNEDILGKNVGPYVSCEDNQWVQVKEIDWAHYIDAGFDEAINCSEFRNQRLLNKVRAQMAILATDPQSASACPVESELLFPLVKKYGELSPFLINTKGHNKAKKYKYFKKLWKQTKRSSVYGPSSAGSVRYQSRKD